MSLFGRVPVLARNHALLRKLSDELTAREVPHQYIGRKSALTNSEEFRRFHAFLKLIVNSHDNFSMLLIKDLIGLSALEYSDIRVRAATEGKSHFQAWMDGNTNDLWREFFEKCDGLSLSYAAEALAEALGFHPQFKSTDEFIGSVLEQHPGFTLKGYLDWLATFDIQDELTDEPEGLTLMTIHAAKGLEYPVVILAGCNEGIIPSKQAIAAGEVEEERRLFYVALTRAKDQCILAVRPERKEVEGRVYENPVSRFVAEAMGCQS
jgi:DNA helicase-2/ATP-dependent DNA helicase PcrA